MAGGFEDLRIWQLAEELVVKIYKLTGLYPKEEVYNLTSQLRRAAVSVPTNIAEAHGRYHDAETIHFIFNARGSAYEVRSLLRTSLDLEYIQKPEFELLDNEYLILIKSVNSFVKSLRTLRKTN